MINLFNISDFLYKLLKRNKENMKYKVLHCKDKLEDYIKNYGYGIFIYEDNIIFHRKNYIKKGICFHNHEGAIVKPKLARFISIYSFPYNTNDYCIKAQIDKNLSNIEIIYHIEIYNIKDKLFTEWCYCNFKINNGNSFIIGNGWINSCDLEVNWEWRYHS